MKNALVLTVAFVATLVMAQDPLLIPPTLSGPVFNLNMQPGTTQFLPGNATVTAGYNGDILGPTLIMNSGDFVTLNVSNSLGETTTTHWHGMHVTPQDDGGPTPSSNPTPCGRPISLCSIRHQPCGTTRTCMETPMYR